VTEVAFKEFRIVLLTALMLMPSHHLAEIVHSLTVDPNAAKNKEDRRAYENAMQGSHKDICVILFAYTIRASALRFLMARRAETVVPSELAFLDKLTTSLADELKAFQESGVNVRSAQPRIADLPPNQKPQR
jgi:hypothetical protein